MTYDMIKLDVNEGVALITLNRPEALNALCNHLIKELGDALQMAEKDDAISAIVITGSQKAFAAGADIKEMKDNDFVGNFLTDFITNGWEAVSDCRKPTIAAVSGFALGGGCELAMMCDIMIASDTAKFGQPEITIGTIPGAGGSQRLTRVVGKSKAMDMVLTGRMMDAEEAERAGLVTRIVPADDLLDEAMKIAKKIASLSRPVVMMAKEAVNTAYETGLRDGLRYERRLFHASFAIEDQKEGMTAFAEKRKPEWKHR